jgi:penicillin-binding protein 1A
MRSALKDMPETELNAPPGIVTVRIDPETGALAGAANRSAILESFREQDVPRAGASGGSAVPAPANEAAGSTATDQLF